MEPPPPGPAAAVRSRSLLHRLLRLPFLLLSAAPFLPRLRLPALSLIAIQDLLLSLSFLRAGLVSHTVELAQGTTQVHLWVPARRRHGRPALVLIHGFGGNAKWQWHRQVVALSSSFDLYVPDLLFFGASRSASADRTVAHQARCVAEAMRRVGVRRYSLCGISYGGFVAYRMAAAEGAGVVERVVLMTAGVGTAAAQRVEMVEREKRDVCEVFLPQRAEDLMELMRRSMHRPPRWVPEFLLTDFIRVMYRELRREREELLRELLANGAGVDPLPVLDQETLILWGDRDKVFPLPLAHQLQSHLGKNSRVEVLEDAGHACQLEKADHVNRLIRSFILQSASSKEE